VVGELMRLPGRGVAMKDEESESKKEDRGRVRLRWIEGSSVAGSDAGLKVDKVRAQKLVTLLLREKVLIKVSDDLVFHRTALEELRRQMTAYKAKSAKIDVASSKR